MDLTAQWLAGDELKQDQFKFLYTVTKVIYDSALREHLLNDDPKILDPVIPNLVAFHSLMVIKGIIETKLFDRKKEQEKLDRSGKKVTFNEEEDEKKLLSEEQVHRKRIEEKLNTSSTSHFSESQKEKEKDKQEIERYGRMWIWEGYFNPAKREQWFAASEKLRKINPHVI